MKKVKPGIYTHKEIKEAYAEGFRKGYATRIAEEKERKKLKIIRKSSYVTCIKEWDNLTELERIKWKEKGKKEGFDGVNCFVRDCQKKLKEQEIAREKARMRFINSVDKKYAELREKREVG